MQYICILGRQPALGLAELESRFGADALRQLQPDIVELSVENEPNFSHFGGVLKVANHLITLETTNFNDLSRNLQDTFAEHLSHIPDGKITVGLSVYGIKPTPQRINAAALSLKKIIKQHGRSVRVVPNKDVFLNTAQVLHNRLTDANGHEFVFVRDGASTILCQTIWVQDIEAYSARDQQRPARDARVGMLPPKLAQIILNLALGQQVPIRQKPVTLLDPFCGTGVLLQEALLQGMHVIGTDLDPRMVEYSRKNLEWLNTSVNYQLDTADATTHQWPQSFDLIACETFLGRPLSSAPDAETLKKIIQDVNVIHKKFLQNIARQTKKGFRMCLALPAWYIGQVHHLAPAESSASPADASRDEELDRFKHLPILDHLEELGYNRVSFVHAKQRDLVYHREGQIVARELVVLTRK